MSGSATSGTKRKLSPGAEEARQSAPPPPPPAAHLAPGVSPINYLLKAKSDRLRLIEGDSDTFGDVLEMIDDYEGMFTFSCRVTGSDITSRSFEGIQCLSRFGRLSDCPDICLN